MKTTTKQLKTNLFLLLLLVCSVSFGQSMATYTITFTGNWNNTDHSNNGMTPLPTNDHWSKLVGGTHNQNVSFWEPGTMASLGVENVAEDGSNTSFFNEVDAAMTAGNADQWLQESFSPNNAQGMATIMTVTVSEEFPLLTLISMIAPSPDWFTGIHDVSLRDGNNWKDTIVLDLFPYDAGTEEGTDYDSGNPETNPQQNISSLINVAPFNDKKVATLTINLESVLSLPSNDFKSGIILSPNPTSGQTFITNTSQENMSHIQIFDVIGKLVKTIGLESAKTKTQLELQGLNAGVYLAKISSTKGNSSIKKLIIK